MFALEGEAQREHGGSYTVAAAWPLGGNMAVSGSEQEQVGRGQRLAELAGHAPAPAPGTYNGGCFWILTGPWARLLNRVRADPAIALVVDACDLGTGMVRQVIARGQAEVVPFDVPRGRRKLSRYLGADDAEWDERFRHYLLDDPAVSGAVWLRVRPESLIAKDLSYSV
ncbi:pyridoxamine 5'-phosphate oxidase family protein [Streptomyces varsoviensis]|uniref:pyridoxamine 5'-phosphate oxidase family protein n=1 Tax=Streptomyces varsoviensis TaxID=67373 RepID=UPI001FE137A9|nr:pyridoxamine 5'-phosphate oxidase family protein [Streptomyces varsoviensis]